MCASSRRRTRASPRSPSEPFGLTSGRSAAELGELVRGYTAGEIPDAQLAAFLADPVAEGPALLQHATSRYVYSFAAVPAVSATLSRDTHHRAALASGIASTLQYAFEYSNGTGRIAMKKIQAEPGLARRC